MSTPTTINIENVVLLLIQGTAPFTNATNAPTANYDSAQALIDKADLLYVQASNPTPYPPNRKPSIPPLGLTSNITVTIRFVSKDITKINDWEAGLDTALALTTGFPAACTNAVNTLFPLGFELGVPDGGDRQAEGAEQRVRTRTMRVVFRP